MMEKMMSIGYPASVGRFRPEQIAQQKTWTKIPEEQRVNASLHVIHMIPSNGSTITHINPVDPGDEAYYHIPASPDRVIGAGRRY
jgi:hypothetical protein